MYLALFSSWYIFKQSNAFTFDEISIKHINNHISKISKLSIDKTNAYNKIIYVCYMNTRDLDEYSSLDRLALNLDIASKETKHNAYSAMVNKVSSCVISENNYLVEIDNRLNLFNLSPPYSPEVQEALTISISNIASFENTISNLDEILNTSEYYKLTSLVDYKSILEAGRKYAKERANDARGIDNVDRLFDHLQKQIAKDNSNENPDKENDS